MTADLVGWHDEHLLDHRRRLRTSVFVSLAIHGVVFAIFAASPPNPIAPTPEYLSVDLVAATPIARPQAKASAAPPAPAASAPPPPAAEPSAPPPVAPAPAIAEAPVQVLPEETPGKIREAPKPPPKVVAKAEPKPTPAPVRRRRREKAVSYEDAMAALADELGVDDSAPLVDPQAPAQEAAPAETGGSASKGIEVSPEQLAWDRRVTQQISKRFVNISRDSGRALVAQVEIDVRADGSLAGETRLIRTSGDVDFDRRAIAAIQLAAPLPPPPEPGKRRLDLTSEAR